MQTKNSLYILILAAIILSACSPSPVGNLALTGDPTALPPTATPTSKPFAIGASPIPRPTLTTPAGRSRAVGETKLDVTYCTADGVALKMDLFFPVNAKTPTPAAVYVHGGGWTGGDKGGGAGMVDMQELVRRGYLGVSINYRLAPDYQFPAQIEDVKCAIRHLRANAQTYNLNPDKIVAWGGSAGGHLVALLGTSDATAGLEGDGGYPGVSSRVAAVVDLFGPADLSRMLGAAAGLETARKVFDARGANDPVLVQASPVTYISRDDPPFLILHGEKDAVVPLKQSEILVEKLKETGIPASLVVVKNAGHGFTPSGGAINPSRAALTQMIADFFDKIVK